MTDPTDAPVELDEEQTEALRTELAPLRKPICTKKLFREIVAKAKSQMLRAPWHVVVEFKDWRRGEAPHRDDLWVYCCIQTQAQYHRMTISVALHHPGWVQEPSIAACVRHEIAHSFWGAYNRELEKHVPEDEKLYELLDNLEDEAVDRIATMPIFDKDLNA